MTLPDKFAEASKQQLATHIDFFQSLTSRMFENAERILALNLETTRATLDQSAGAARQLAAVREPRDLLALRAQSQQQVEAVMAYSRKLFEIANKPVAVPAAAPADDRHIDTAPPVVEAASAPESTPESAPESAPESDSAPASAALAPSAHPLGEADPEPASAPVIDATVTPIAQAVSAVLAAPLEVPHPAASPMPEARDIIIPPIAPVDAAPAPVEASTAPPVKRAGKGSKKR
jgi:phasin family protein